MTDEETPANQSPDTETDPETEEVDLGALVEETVRRVIGEGSPDAGAGDQEGTAGGGEPDPSSLGASSPAAAPSTREPDVDAAVARALADRDHAEQHRTLAEPPPDPEPRPKRRGIAAALFGADRG